MDVFSAVASIFEPVGKLVDDLFTNDEERGKLENALFEAKSNLTQKFLEHEAKLVKAQSDIITAEATGQSWIQRNWRPLTMLTFVGLIVARWMGFTAPGMSEAEYLSVYDLMKLGLGGYVAGRTLEKIAPTVLDTWRATK
ncbi:MAG: holin family protein [Parvibaculaceae bacterium]|nr:holin family protein [Parvibaculaceae bacterium]